MPACCHFSDLAESYEYSPANTGAVKGPTCPNQTPQKASAMTTSLAWNFSRGVSGTEDAQRSLKIKKACSPD